MAQPKLHMIGNAHLDPVWLWRWQEGCAEAIGTCWAAVELLEEYPGVVFTRGEAVVYRWIEELDPELFSRIAQLVRAKQWVIVNGWWLQPDCNLPDGESFIRQALYGKRYFRQRFGVDIRVGYNVDSFGHAGTLPMLLRHTGSAQYVFMRPMEHEHPLSAPLFKWVSPDGSSVSTFRIPVSYNTSRAARSIETKVEATEALALQTGMPMMCFFGVGNHGGGPTRADVEKIIQLRAEGHDLVFSDPAGYFAEVADLPLPVVSGELQMHAIGCYSAVSSLKALNRRVEACLAQAESAATLALLHTGTAYPHAHLQKLWETVLFNQFHDILCGSCVPSAVRDAEQAFGGVIQEAEVVTDSALRRLAASVAPGPDPTDATFIVFNLTGAEQHTALEYEPWTSWELSTYRLLDDSGSEVSYQDVQPENYTHAGLHRILFVPNVPAFGYRMFRFVRRTPPSAVPSTLQASTTVLESARWRLQIDPVTGGIASLEDKTAGRSVFGGTAHQPLVVDDPSDTWSHGLERFAIEGTSFVFESARIIEDGPLRAAIRVRSRAGHSTLTSTYLLYDDPQLPLEIRVAIDWHGRHQLVRLCYPLALSAPVFRYEVPYGSIERPDDGREYPGLRWVLASSTDGYGVAIANDAKYSYAAAGGVLYVTALRSPVFAHHDPYTLDPAGEYPYVDQGEQSFTLSILAGSGIGATAAHRLADALLRRPIATPHVARTGSGAQSAGLLELQTHSSSAVWLKTSEDGEAAILRLLEHEGTPDTVGISPSSAGYQVPAHGVVTLRREADGRWLSVNGLEDKESE